MAIEKLTPRFCETVKATGKYADGGGLYLQVKNGGKSWVYRYADDDGHEHWHGLGSFDTWGLAEARERAKKCRQQRKDSIDPIKAHKQAKQDKKLADLKQISFREQAEEWVVHMEGPGGWDDVTSKKVRGQLKNHVYPMLGDYPITAFDNDIRIPNSPAVVLIYKMLTHDDLWTKHPPTGENVRQSVDAILRYAKSNRAIADGSAADMEGDLGRLLRRIEKFHVVKPRKDMPYPDVPNFMKELQSQYEDEHRGRLKPEMRDQIRQLRARWGYGRGTQTRIAEALGADSTAICNMEKRMRKEGASEPRRTTLSELLELIIRTAVRVKEARLMEWSEIEGNTWTTWKHKNVKITKQPHIIPLSQQVMDLLQRVRERQAAEGIESKWVFLTDYRRREKPIGEDRPLFLLRKMGQPYDAHGFRTSFRIWGSEETDYPDVLFDFALGHKVKIRDIDGYTQNRVVDETDARYRRGAQKVEQRRPLMQDWSNFCDGKFERRGVLVPFHKGSKEKTA